MNNSSFEEYLEAHGSLTYRSTGSSMRPLLRQDRDLFIVRKKGAERCRAGDVVLYRRQPASYVLHRIVEVRPADYVILGDNCVVRESGIRDEDILGVLTGFVRDGKRHSVTEPGYRAYAFLWLHTAPLRIASKKLVLRIRHRIKDRK
jgi:hypothetical protein